MRKLMTGYTILFYVSALVIEYDEIIIDEAFERMNVSISGLTLSDN